MAKVYLRGGPCAGKTVTLTQEEADSGELVCGGDLYKNPYTGQTHGGLLVFLDAGKAPPAGGGGGGIPVADTNVYKAWPDLQRSINTRLPTALRSIGISQRRLLHQLAHQRKVR